jgi:hypothetical protein
VPRPESRPAVPNYEKHGNEKEGKQKVRRGHDGAGREELPDRVKIAHLIGQYADGGRPLSHLDGQDMRKNIGGKNDVELLARHVDDAGSDRAQNKIESNCNAQPNAQSDERGNRGIRHHAVIDIHREERRREREHVDKERGDSDMAVIRPELANDAPEPMRLRYLPGRARALVRRSGWSDEEGVAHIVRFERRRPHLSLRAGGWVDDSQLFRACVDLGQDTSRPILHDQDCRKNEGRDVVKRPLDRLNLQAHAVGGAIE